VDDKRIELTAYDIKYKGPQLGKDSSVSITSYNGKVLLTGTVPTAEVDRRFAEQVAGIAGVRNVIDETSIGAPRSVSDTAKDSYITSKVKISLFGVGGKPSDPTYIKVVTSGGVVYLMGLVTRAEGDAAADQVRYIEGVKRVVKLFEYR
jgi:osmotically-inducible protein OsmY